MTKQETLQKGIGGTIFDFTKTFSNQLFSRKRVLFYRCTITNHIESILKSKITRILMNIFVVVVFLSDLLNCNCCLFYLDDNIFT